MERRPYIMPTNTTLPGGKASRKRAKPGTHVKSEGGVVVAQRIKPSASKSTKPKKAPVQAPPNTKKGIAQAMNAMGKSAYLRSKAQEKADVDVGVAKANRDLRRTHLMQMVIRTFVLNFIVQEVFEKLMNALKWRGEVMTAVDKAKFLSQEGLVPQSGGHALLIRGSVAFRQAEKMRAYERTAFDRVGVLKRKIAALGFKVNDATFAEFMEMHEDGKHQYSTVRQGLREEDGEGVRVSHRTLYWVSQAFHHLKRESEKMKNGAKVVKKKLGYLHRKKNAKRMAALRDKARMGKALQEDMGDQDQAFHVSRAGALVTVMEATTAIQDERDLEHSRAVASGIDALQRDAPVAGRVEVFQPSRLERRAGNISWLGAARSDEASRVSANQLLAELRDSLYGRVFSELDTERDFLEMDEITERRALHAAMLRERRSVRAASSDGYGLYLQRTSNSRMHALNGNTCMADKIRQQLRDGKELEDAQIKQVGNLIRKKLDELKVEHADVIADHVCKNNDWLSKILKAIKEKKDHKAHYRWVAATVKTELEVGKVKDFLMTPEEGRESYKKPPPTPKDIGGAEPAKRDAKPIYEVGEESRVWFSLGDDMLNVLPTVRLQSIHADLMSDGTLVPTHEEIMDSIAASSRVVRHKLPDSLILVLATMMFVLCATLAQPKYIMGVQVVEPVASLYTVMGLAGVRATTLEEIQDFEDLTELEWACKGKPTWAIVKDWYTEEAMPEEVGWLHGAARSFAYAALEYTFGDDCDRWLEARLFNLHYGECPYVEKETTRRDHGSCLILAFGTLILIGWVRHCIRYMDPMDPLYVRVAQNGLCINILATSKHSQGDEEEQRSHIDRKEKLLARASYANWEMRVIYYRPKPYYGYMPWQCLRVLDAQILPPIVTDSVSHEPVDMTRSMANVVQAVDATKEALELARRITQTKIARERGVNETLLDSIRQQTVHNPVTRAEICSTMGLAFDQEQGFWDPLAAKASS